MTRPRVLIDTRQRHWDQNPYISLLVSSVTPTAHVTGFSWRRALLGSYSVIHVHWPEYLTRHDSRLLKAVARCLLALWILRIWILRTPVIKTVHNLRPHSASDSRADKWLMDAMGRRYTHEIWLQDPSLVGIVPSRPWTLIPHGDYMPWLNQYGIDADAATARCPKNTHHKMLCFGILKDYKCFHEPILALRRLRHLSLKLMVCGHAPDEPYLEYLRALASDDDRIVIMPGRLSDEDLVREILDSDVVIAPYAEMFNSGVVLLALNIGRPVVVRDNAVTRSLQNEFGSNWVYTYSGNFDQDTLTRLSTDLPHLGGERVLSDLREWGHVGDLHSKLYASPRAS